MVRLDFFGEAAVVVEVFGGFEQSVAADFTGDFRS